LTEYYFDDPVSAVKALTVTMLVSFILVLPLFFEPDVKSRSVMEYRELNSSHGMLVRPFRITLTVLNCGTCLIVDLELNKIGLACANGQLENFIRP